jgi:hypothetical protein
MTRMARPLVADGGESYDATLQQMPSRMHHAMMVHMHILHGRIAVTINHCWGVGAAIECVEQEAIGADELMPTAVIGNKRNVNMPHTNTPTKRVNDTSFIRVKQTQNSDVYAERARKRQGKNTQPAGGQGRKKIPKQGKPFFFAFAPLLPLLRRRSS